MFAMVDTENDLKVLGTSGLACEKLVDIQAQYRVWGSKKEKDSLVDLPSVIIEPYYMNIKGECTKNNAACHSAWVHTLDEEHVKFAAKDAYTSYEMYKRIIDMRKCLRPTPGEGRATEQWR